MHFLTSALLHLGTLTTVNALTASPGCGKALPSGIKTGVTGQSNTLTLTSGGLTRSFLLHIPTNYNINSPRSLIFSFHGRGGASATQEKLSSFSDPYFNTDALAVYPQGISNQWQGDPAATTDDVTFTLDMIAYLEARFCIDSDAIFSTGKSNGGGFSLNVLACDEVASTKVAAFAANSGAYYADNAANGSCSPLTVPLPCTPGRTNVPLLEIHGSADPTIPYNGGPRRGYCLPTVPHFIQAWAARDGLSTVNTTTKSYSKQLHKAEFGSGTSLGLVTSYWVNALTHSWASTLSNSDSSTPTFINATSIMMDWFAGHKLA